MRTKQDVKELIVDPIDRMTTIVRKLAGTIFFLAADDEEERQQLESG